MGDGRWLIGSYSYSPQFMLRIKKSLVGYEAWIFKKWICTCITVPGIKKKNQIDKSM